MSPPPPIRLAPADHARVLRSFVRGRAHPRGVVWLGFRSFWGHMRHLVASAIATEDVDSRDWMTPDDPDELAERVAALLGAEPLDPGAYGRPSLVPSDVVSRLGRDLWIDFVADTGDDISVSRAVARLVAGTYEVTDPDAPDEPLLAPRGDVLFFGGDTAYPVATAQEISNRVLVPFNEELARHDDGRTRVLLGIPGNHDWYDGLDGFARVFRRRPEEEDVDARPSVVGIPFRQLEHVADWARELVLGGKMAKPEALVLQGYVPVQSASYFVLPLTASIHVVAVDRQLRVLDHRQVRYHRAWLEQNPQICPWVVMPDPLFSFGEVSPTGASVVRDLGLSFGLRDHFLLSGDIHHYERIEEPGLLHVVAGGGGAFLHPAPMVPKPRRAKARWPSVAQSKALLWSVPGKIVLGRSGFIPHAALAAVFGPAMTMALQVSEGSQVRLLAPVLTTLAVAAALALIGGLRKRPRAVVALATASALVIAALPVLATVPLLVALDAWGVAAPTWGVRAFAFASAVLLGAGVVGAYLALLTRLGLEETQAFTTLDHPGFKHFVRFRVRADGARVDAWCIGVADPLGADAEPVLVDRFTWRVGEEGS